MVGTRSVRSERSVAAVAVVLAVPWRTEGGGTAGSATWLRLVEFTGGNAADEEPPSRGFPSTAPLPLVPLPLPLPAAALVGTRW